MNELRLSVRLSPYSLDRLNRCCQSSLFILLPPTRGHFRGFSRLTTEISSREAFKSELNDRSQRWHRSLHLKNGGGRLMTTGGRQSIIYNLKNGAGSQRSNRHRERLNTTVTLVLPRHIHRPPSLDSLLGSARGSVRSLSRHGRPSTSLDGARGHSVACSQQTGQRKIPYRSFARA